MSETVTVTQLYEVLYGTAVSFLIPAMGKLTGSGFLSTEEKTRLQNGIKLWLEVVGQMRPAVPVDLDREAVEAIVRSYTK